MFKKITSRSFKYDDNQDILINYFTIVQIITFKTKKNRCGNDFYGKKHHPYIKFGYKIEKFVCDTFKMKSHPASKVLGTLN